ncbi:uncharacterized protein LOC133196541 isoform X1 [Saccostrea echinata]|uniref:uncharacterized protein LOC133196541 isoform X1 n=1 Tax=Saccostrea echinata TaxID=191078 RepID=UPI002A82070D|nr:uncharacterized protein LOC133196541 isoform X1 [Saccostrea echinata]
MLSKTGSIQILEMLLVLFLCCGTLIPQSLASTTQDIRSSTDNSTEQTNGMTNTSESTVTAKLITNTSESTVTAAMATTTAVNDLWCYSCSDTKRGADCQANIKTMAGEAGEVQRKTTQDGRNTRKYVKNCGGYYNFTYCLIETIENRGEVHSYIRDCSDGVSFSYSLAKLTNVHPDNQTTCGYTGQGYVICVRLCRSDFCNGPRPLSAANTDKNRNGLLFILFMAYYLVF